MSQSFWKNTTLLNLALILMGANTCAHADFVHLVSQQGWQFEVAPYLWALNLNGTTQTGPASVHIDQSFSDIMSDFNGGGMVYLDAHKKRLGFFLNGMYANLSDDVKVRGLLPVDINDKFGLVTGGISYKTYIKESEFYPARIELEPYLGARYTLNDTSIKVFHLHPSENQNWTDPIIGSRLNYIMGKHWETILAADVGGTSSSDDSLSASGLLGYSPSNHYFENTILYGGYRYLHQNYETGSALKKYDWDMNLFGPVVGAGVRF